MIINDVLPFIYGDAFRELRALPHPPPERFLFDTIGESQEGGSQNILRHRVFNFLKGFELSRLFVDLH